MIAQTCVYECVVESPLGARNREIPHTSTLLLSRATQKSSVGPIRMVI